MYDHRKIEKKWQKFWKSENIFKTKDKIFGKKNEYILVEFPYPSGNLHVGHWYAFSVSDIYAKYERMIGRNVLFPIGFDAFGLPAENAAIKHGLNPREWTHKNVEMMEKQLISMGASFDWSRSVTTCDPNYYKWTQWLFIQFFKKGLAYQKDSPVNWCPSCKTVLANEQVVGGHCERCDSEVEQREMKQWFIKITDYADRLLDDLEKLDWPNAIKESQKAWIGKSEGSLIPFKIKDLNISFEVFTTRADTLFGATYVVFAPESDLTKQVLPLASNKQKLQVYIEKTTRKTELERISGEKEKTGVKVEGVFAINPGNQEEIPIFIADYVLANYGTGAVMAVPAHDDRDWEFARDIIKDQNFISPVIIPLTIDDYSKEKSQKITLRYGSGENGLEELISEIENGQHCYIKEGKLINSDQFNGLNSEEAKIKITEAVGGELSKNYRLRDWLVSRQRYWGCPIPLIHCSKCGVVPDENLPVVLPEITDYKPSGDGKSPLMKISSWKNVKCPKCGGEAERETDTLDTFVDSSWYYLRYLDPKNEEEFASKKKIKKWMPVEFYSGGAEHNTMHLLFARFFYKVLYDLGLVSEDEPFKKRLNRGLMLGPDGVKMSKSRGNVVDPDEVVENVGSDTVRMYLAFIGPYNEPGHYPWDPSGVVGIKRFLEKVFYLSDKLSDRSNEEIVKNLHKTIKKVEEDIKRLKFNTAISQMMNFINLVEENKISKKDFSIFLKILSPFAPHLSEELWNKIGEKKSVHLSKWPKYDVQLAKDEMITMAVQINGKTRTEIEIKNDSPEESVKELAMNNAVVQKWTEGKHIKKVIYVPNRIINIII